MHGLNIHLLSFKLYSNSIHPNDKIRVSITTIPEENKQSFVIDMKKINEIHHFFNVNISEKTKKIIVVFRKKSIIQSDPIIASTIIHSNEFPKSCYDSNNTELKQISIYEPIKNRAELRENRQALGQMQVQLSLQDAFPDGTFTTKCNYKISKIHKGEGYSKVNACNKNNNENDYQDNSLFVENFVPIN